MNEKNKPKSEQPKEKSPGFGDPFAGGDQSDAPQEATVGSGVYLEKLPVGGMTVAAVRDKYADRMDIAPGAEAFIDGAKVDPETIVKQGQTLRFAHKAGEKG